MLLHVLSWLHASKHGAGPRRSTAAALGWLELAGGAWLARGVDE